MSADTEDKKIVERKPFTPEEWAELVVMYESGEYTLADLEEKSGRTASTLSRKFTKAGIVKGSAAEVAADEAREAMAIEHKSRAEKDIENWRAINLEFGTIGQFIQMSLKNLLATKSELGLQKATQEVKLLNVAADVNDKAYLQRITALGLKEDFVDDEKITKLSVTEMSAERIEEIQRKQTIQAGHDPDKMDKDELEIMSVGTPSNLVQN